MGEVTKVHEKMATSFMFGPSLKEGGYLISLKNQSTNSERQEVKTLPRTICHLISFSKVQSFKHNEWKTT